MLEKTTNDIDWLGVAIDTNDSEYHAHPTIVLYGPKYISRWKLPFKSLYAKLCSYPYTRVTGEKTQLSVLLNKRWSIIYSKTDHTFHIDKGHQTEEWILQEKCNIDVDSSFTSFFVLPWKRSRMIQRNLLNIDGSLFHKVNKNDEFDPWNYPNHETVDVQFKDGFDGTSIIATCKIDERVFAVGDGYFKWLSMFFQKTAYRDVEMDFSKEVGKEKGSWKGGIISTSTKFIENNVEKSVRSFTESNKHIYIGLVTSDKIETVKEK